MKLNSTKKIRECIFNAIKDWHEYIEVDFEELASDETLDYWVKSWVNDLEMDEE